MFLRENNEILWMPVSNTSGIATVLNSVFAKQCAECPVTDIDRFMQNVWTHSWQSGQVPSSFLDIKSGILPKGIYKGNNGIWLTLAETEPADDQRPYMYHGHNDDLASDQLWLLRAFGSWAQVAKSTIGNKSIAT